MTVAVVGKLSSYISLKHYNLNLHYEGPV